MALEDKIQEIRDRFERETATVPPEQLRTRYLGREGAVRDLFALLKSVPAAEKGAAGQQLNAFKASLEAKIEELSRSHAQAKPRTSIDLSLPGRAPRLEMRREARPTMAAASMLGPVVRVVWPPTTGTP